MTGLWCGSDEEGCSHNWWALLALALVLATAAGNILVCLAITWERRLQNVTNYFLMSLAITDLMVAILVMPLGILTLVRGFFPLPPVYCLAWICLDVLFCTASIMHLCTISVDRYLSLRYPMKFGRNKSRRRVTLKIVFVWLLSIAMSLPLSLMYSQDYNSVLVEGICQIPDPLYKLIGSIVSFYIPLGVMLLTYALTVRLLALQQRNLGGNTTDWSSGWLGGPTHIGGIERRCTWRRLLLPAANTGGKSVGNSGVSGCTPGAAHHSSAGSTDTELTTLDTHELWLPESEPKPYTMSALHHFGAEMLKLSRGLQSVATTPPIIDTSKEVVREVDEEKEEFIKRDDGGNRGRARRRASTIHAPFRRQSVTQSSLEIRKRVFSYQEPSTKWSSSSSDEENQEVKQNEMQNSNEDKPRGYSRIDSQEKDVEADPLSLLPPPCTCPYFGDSETSKKPPRNNEVVIITTEEKPGFLRAPVSPGEDSPLRGITRKKYSDGSNMIVTWESPQRRQHRRGSSFSSGSVRTSVSRSGDTSPNVRKSGPILRRAATLRTGGREDFKVLEDAAQGVLLRYGSSPSMTRNLVVKSPHSRNSSVISRTSSRHGRIIRLEQKATKVLGVVFFTFVILWAPFFVLNLIPSVCAECERNIDKWVFDFVTWLGYASSMVNPIFYTIFNKVFRQAFKKVLLCRYRKKSWKPNK